MPMMTKTEMLDPRNPRLMDMVEDSDGILTTDDLDALPLFETGNDPDGTYELTRRESALYLLEGVRRGDKPGRTREAVEQKLASARQDVETGRPAHDEINNIPMYEWVLAQA